MNPTITIPSALQKGWLARSQKARDKTLKARDPARLLASAIRQRSNELGDVQKIALDEFDKTHKPVLTPLPALVHQHLADLIVTFLAEKGLNGRDLTKPIRDHEPLESIVERHRARIVAERQAYEAELAGLEREQAIERVQAAEVALERVDLKHEVHGIEQPAKRGPGRPRKVVIDESAAVQPK